MMFWLGKLSVANVEQIIEESQEEIQKLFGDAQIESNMVAEYAKNQLQYLIVQSNTSWPKCFSYMNLMRMYVGNT